MPELEFLVKDNSGWAFFRDETRLKKFVYVEEGLHQHIVEMRYKIRDNTIPFLAGKGRFLIVIDSEQTECTPLESKAVLEFNKYIFLNAPKPPKESLKELSDYLTSLVETGPSEDMRIDINEEIGKYCKLPWRITSSLFIGAEPGSRWCETDLIKEGYEGQEITIQYLPQKKQYLLSIRLSGADNHYVLMDQHPSLDALRANQEGWYETLKPEEKSDICTRVNQKQDISNNYFYESFSHLMNSLMTMDRPSFITAFLDYNPVEIPSNQAAMLRGISVIHIKKETE